MSKYGLTCLAIFGMLLIGTVVVETTTAYASTLSKESPSLATSGEMLNQSADQADVDISIDPTDDLPSNGTQTIPTAGATDIDINDFPPEGVAVIIENKIVTVTNHSVSIEQE